MPKTVLLADDSVVIQKLVGLSFANEDLRLITTDNGDDALARAREEKPDLVLADVVMPGRNGYELCQAIKQEPDLSHVPVLLLTGTFEAFDDERARQVGSVGHITKPFEAQGLVDRVQELLARGPEPAATPPVEAPRAPLPVAEPTMIVEPDEAYDFFDDDGADLATTEPAAEEPVVDLGVGDADEAFDFGLDPVAELEPQSPVVAPQAPAAEAPETGGDLTVAMVPELPPAEAPPQLIPEDPMATRLTFDEPLGAPADAGAERAPEAMPPAPAPTPAAPPPITSEDSFGGQNTAPLTSPPPLTASDPPPTQIIEGLSHDVPPPLPPSADPGETILADDLFAAPPPLPTAHMTPYPPQETATSAANEDLEFSFNTGPSTAQPAAPPQPAATPPPIPVEPAPTGDPFAGGASEPAATTDPLIDTLEMDPPAAALDAGPLATAPANNLPSEPLAVEDFAADAGADSDLLQPFSAQDAADYDVSSSDLGDPLRVDEPQLVPAADISSSHTAQDATPALPQPMPEQPEIAATPLEPQAEEPTDALVVEETSPALVVEETARALASEEGPASSEAIPDISPIMRDRIHETLEKVAWEAFADLSDTIVRQVVQKVEQIAWEVVPQMAESLIQEEIRRMKGKPEDAS
jgi:CheY-like chemotaxis protein